MLVTEQKQNCKLKESKLRKISSANMAKSILAICGIISFVLLGLIEFDKGFIPCEHPDQWNLLWKGVLYSMVAGIIMYFCTATISHTEQVVNIHGNVNIQNAQVDTMNT